MSPIPGRSHARHVRAATRIGRDLILPLREYAQSIGFRFADRTIISRLFSRKGRITGATGVTQEGSLLTTVAHCVILATGGYAQIFFHTNNAPGVTGDGQALAFRLGLPLQDMEFVQFYPTALGKFGSRILLYEASVLQAGALLTNAGGENIIPKDGLSNPMRMTRDRLAQAITQEIFEGQGQDGSVIMDLETVSQEMAERMRMDTTI